MGAFSTSWSKRRSKGPSTALSRFLDHRIALTLVLPALVLSASCDPLVEEGFQGEVLFTIEGRVVDFNFSDTQLDYPLASLFWASGGDTTIDPNLLRAQSEVSVRVAFPATFSINVFEAPILNDIGTRPYAIGQLVVWQDDNDDGEYSASEFRGGALEHVILFADRELAPQESPTGRTLPKGFSLASLPLPCQEIPVVPQADDCGVPLGAECSPDASECGAFGACLLDDGFTSYPDGYCVLPTNMDCFPTGGVVLGINNEDLGYEVWVKGCASPLDCRPEYSCELWLGGCLPKQPLAIIIDPNSDFHPLCEPPFGPR